MSVSRQPDITGTPVDPATIPRPQRLRQGRECAVPRKTNLDSISAAAADEYGYTIALDEESVNNIVASGLNTKNLVLACVATDILLDEQPITLRGLFYRVVSAGLLPSTDAKHYRRLNRVMTTLREFGVVDFRWIVDNLRSSLKPSSWTGLQEYLETCRDAYRKDCWSRIPDYVHVIVEKDAIAGVIQPVTSLFDVTLSPVRGYASLSYAHEIGSTWARTQKPIHAFYLGDFDPSGFDIERDLREKLARYSGRQFEWTRLAVHPEDFDEFNLIPLAVKPHDMRSAKFIKEHGHACAEVDALPASELRNRVRSAIEQFIPQDEWDRLKRNEEAERATIRQLVAKLPALPYGGKWDSEDEPDQ